MSAYSARPDGTVRRRSDGRRSGEPVRLDRLADAPVPPKVVRHTGTFLYEDQHTLSARSAWPVHVVSWLLPGRLIVSRMVAGIVFSRIVMRRWVPYRSGARCPGGWHASFGFPSFAFPAASP